MEGWAQVRVGAGVLLALYAGLAAVFSARELRFLAGVEPRQRRWFVLQDILIQVAILGVLLPCALAPERSLPVFYIIMAGFTLLWIAALWTVISRSMYTYRLMLGIRGQRKNIEAQIAELMAKDTEDG
jgi:phosphatidylglycerophosphate synthase